MGEVKNQQSQPPPIELAFLSSTHDTVSPLSGIAVNARIQPYQQTPGIRISLAMRNISDKPINLDNPLDFLTIELYDQSGNWVSPPIPMSRLVIKGKHVPLAVPFSINSVEFDGKKISYDDYQAHSFLFRPGSDMRIEFTENKIRKLDSSETADQTTAIPPGVYRIKLNLSLVPDEKPGVPLMLSSNVANVHLTPSPGEHGIVNDPPRLSKENLQTLTVTGQDAQTPSVLVDGYFVFPDTHQRGMLQHDFVLMNKTKSDIMISNLDTSCGCTSAVVLTGERLMPLPVVVHPNQKIKIRGVIDLTKVSASEDEFRKYLWLRGPGQQDPMATLEMTGKVIP